MIYSIILILNSVLASDLLSDISLIIFKSHSLLKSITTMVYMTINIQSDTLTS
ncbi:hypothetical protein SASC598J21_006690 [Snodgrassella alvi SCGC AB-598-J21]|uniref:Uncharacterized protein n=1 Tax=Snodgrassella alvi SCGC AB-598-J21 TaxID=1385367 RepID=A0A074VCH7_9NEIS|nr:hypothetical protein SASC598J21_006690 [Snodgrassella alvi SCGC AB-598-J21]